MAFNWSQFKLGGLSACTAISVFAAANFADGGIVTEERLRMLSVAGCELWARHHRRSQSVAEILDVQPFFQTSYVTVSWQCGDGEGQLPLAELLQQEEFGATRWGAVVTDGLSSVSVGRDGPDWFMFDSHGPKARFWRVARPTDVPLSQSLCVRGAVDVTMFARR